MWVMTAWQPVGKLIASCLGPLELAALVWRQLRVAFCCTLPVEGLAFSMAPLPVEGLAFSMAPINFPAARQRTEVLLSAVPAERRWFVRWRLNVPAASGRRAAAKRKARSG